MEILDLGKISRDIENKNQEFNIIYDKEFRKFENNLLYEIEEEDNINKKALWELRKH